MPRSWLCHRERNVSREFLASLDRASRGSRPLKLTPWNRQDPPNQTDMHATSLTLLLGAVSPALALPSQNTFSAGKPKAPTSLPVVLWHGLGDTYDGDGLMQVAETINETYPGTFVHSIYLNEEPSGDRNAGFMGHLDDQVPSFLPCRAIADAGIDCVCL